MRSGLFMKNSLGLFLKFFLLQLISLLLLTWFIAMPLLEKNLLLTATQIKLIAAKNLTLPGFSIERPAKDSMLIKSWHPYNLKLSESLNQILSEEIEAHVHQSEQTPDHFWVTMKAPQKRALAIKIEKNRLQQPYGGWLMAMLLISTVFSLLFSLYAQNSQHRRHHENKSTQPE